MDRDYLEKFELEYQDLYEIFAMDTSVKANPKARKARKKFMGADPIQFDSSAREWNNEIRF